MRHLPTVIIASLCAACATAKTTASPSAELAVETDPWALTIAVGRRGVLIDRAMEGGTIAASPSEEDETNLRTRIQRELNQNVLALYRLRAHLCETGVSDASECGPLPPPQWLGDGAGAEATPEELARRLTWLEEASAPFIDAGCRAGETQRDDPFFCAVE